MGEKQEVKTPDGEGYEVEATVHAGDYQPIEQREITREMMHLAHLGIQSAQKLCHDVAHNGGWWHDINTGKPKQRNDGELLMLMVSELAEAMEGVRKNKMDEHLPTRPQVEVELADAIIRILDYAGGRGYDVAGAMVAKLKYNMHRADHKVESRRGEGGKTF